MSSNQLRLEDCLEDSPQTRALIGVYEKDSETLLKYSQGLYTACNRLSYAQNELSLATQSLAQNLRNFQDLNFSVGTEDELIGSTIQQLATSIDEISSYNAILYTQLSEDMMHHSSKFLKKDMQDFLRLQTSFRANDKSHEEASAKLAKISKKRPSEKGWQEATDQLYAARKGFHNTSMLYTSCLNTLQTKKKVGLIRPVISFLEAQIAFFRMGSEVAKPELEQILEKLTSNITEVEKEIDENRDLQVEKMDRMDAESTRSYIPDPPASMDFPDLPVDRSKTQISGYLFIRVRGGIIHQWQRNYFFTQAGNLMQQSKNELAGRLVLDLDNCASELADIDDRRNSLQIVSQDGKKSVYLQAESKQKCLEWLATIRNIAAGLYLHDDPREAVLLANKEPPTLDQSEPASQSITPAIPQGVPPSDEAPARSEAKPSVFERIKQAATALIATDERPRSESDHRMDTASTQDLRGSLSGASGDGGLDMLLDADEPILFDLPSPISDFSPPFQVQQKSGENKKPSNENVESGLATLNLDDTSSTNQQPRQNPFSSESALMTNQAEHESAFKAMFIVRFLGCKRVARDIDLEASITETIWQVMAARALHKMFRMNELHLVVSDTNVRMVDPATQLCRESFPVASVLGVKTHIDNRRLLGFVVDRSDHLMCYTFESNADGDDVCCAINTARVMEQSKMEHAESARQHEVESDLEAQSRLISASTNVGPTASEDKVENSEVEASKNLPEN